MKGERTYKVKGERLKVKGLLLFFFLSIFNFQFSTCWAQELLNYPLDTVNGEEVYKYEVERSIGLYRVGINFNVSQSEILRLNPQLRERGLHYGETLLLPTGRKVEAKIQRLPSIPMDTVVKEKPEIKEAPVDTVVPAETVVVPQDTVMPQTDTIEVAAEPAQPDHRRVIELALMLPFESHQTKRSGNADRMMEFYEGALLALRDLQNDSILYRLRVYDTERSERKVNELCDSTELDSVKGILGLVYPIQIERMTAWCDAHQVPLILPFSDDVSLMRHPYVYQFNSPDADEIGALAQWIVNREDRHCVFVDTKEADMTTSMRLLRKKLKEQDVPYSTLALRDLLNDSVGYAVDSFQENIFILHSDRYQHVRMALPHIAKIQVAKLLVSQYAWQRENISMHQVYTSKFITDTDLTEYDRLWEQSYVNEHVSDLPRYDLLGYDLMREIVHIVLQKKGEKNPLQSPITWESRSEKDGWQNTFIQIVEK